MNTTENIVTPKPLAQIVKPVKFPAQPQEWKIVSLRECPTPNDMQLCDTPDEAAAYWKAHITNHPYFNPECECLVVFIINTRRRIKGHYLVSTGTMDTILCHASRVLIKKILRDREIASQIQNRMDLEKLPDSVRAALQVELAKHIPRTVVALDEAQELLGDRGGREKEALEDFCLIGRNFGLSMILATQRPETSAISSKVRDQAGTWFIHQLGSLANINVVAENLVASLPKSIRDGTSDLDFAGVIRRLDTGQALVASKKMNNGQGINRAFIMDVRPRVRVHGGEAS